MDGFGYATNFPAGDITSPAIIARHQNCVNAASCADNSASSVTVCDDPETNRPMLYPDKRLPTPKQQSVCFSDELSVAAAVKPDDVTKGSFPCLVNGSPVFAERKNSTGTLNNHSSQDAVQRSSPSKTSADTNQQPVCNKGFDAETMQSDIKPVDGAVVTATNDTQRTSPKVLHVQFLNGQPCTPLNGNHVDGKSLGSPITPLCSSSSSSSSSSSDDDSSLDFATTRRPVPPDGGWGWVIVAAAFCVNLIADGLSFSFGVIFVDFLDYFGDGKSRTAWIGSLFMGMPLLSGPVASFLTDRYGCRRVTIAGAILAASGFALSSCANSINQLLLTFGVLAGFGLSLCYVAAVVIVAYYFDRKRSLATGLSVCGSGIGTFLFAPLTQMLIDEYGWRGTMLILAGIFLNMAVCGALMRDLPWTVDLAKAKARDRKQARRRMRVRNAARAAGSSAESFTASNSTNTYSQLQPLTNAVACESEDCAVSDCKDPHNTSDAIVPSVPRQFSSLVNLPTYVRNGDSVPLETLELLSTHRDAFDLLLLHHYPGLRMVGSRSFSDSGRLNEDHRVQPLPVVTEKHLRALEEADLKDESKKHALLKPANGLAVGGSHDTARAWWPARKTQSNVTSPTGNLDNVANKRLQASYLKDLRVHRHSLTYRGAMLNINRYRLRASSCPDIYRNSMTTIAREQYDNWPWDGLWEFWDLLRDMLDLSHFADTRYLFFALSNFLLYMWYDVMYIYLADNAIGMGVSEQDASMLLSVIGILNMVGEIFLGWAGDMPWMNAGLVYALCMCLCGAATAIVPLMSDYIGLCVASGAFGLFIAANYSLTSIILVELITLERFTNAYGLLLLVQGIANLVGPPLAGWIGDITGSYDLSFYLAGLFIALSGAVLVVIPLVTVLKKCQKSQRAKVDLEGCANNKTANHHGAKKEVVYINALHPVAKKSSANDGFLGCFTKETNKGLTDNGIHV